MSILQRIARLFSARTPLVVPPEYVGVWKGDKLDLTISAEGDVRFRQSTTVVTDGNASTTCRNVSGAIAGWDGDSFNVGAPGSNVVFRVDSAPSAAGEMTMNGIVLRRQLDTW